MKKLPTEFQINVYKACHCQYDGLTISEAATRLGVLPAKVKQAIRAIRKITPVILLTKNEGHIRNFIHDFGLTHEQVARVMDMTVKNVERIVMNLRKKGIVSMPKPKTVQYNGTFADDKIVRKF